MTFKISTDYTFFFKYLLPLIFILILGGIATLLYLQGETRAFIVTILLTIGGGYWLYFLLGKIKSVSLDNDYFYISNFLKTEKVPIADLKEVSDRSWPGSYKPVTMRFGHEYSFGRSIVFLPEFEDPMSPSSISLAEKLRRLIK